MRRLVGCALLLMLAMGLYVAQAQEAAVETIYVFTDRFVYRPGMVAVVNVVVRDAEGVPLGGVGVYVSMADPFDQVVFERVGSTFANGSFVTYAVIPADAGEGYYRLDAVALVDIVPTPSSTVNILVCRLCFAYDNVTSNMPSVVTVTETEFIPFTSTVTVSRETTLAATTVTETYSHTVTSVSTRSVFLTATAVVNPYSYVPGLAALAFAGYAMALLVLRWRRVRSG